MNKARVQQAMRRMGIVPVPLAHITDPTAFRSAASQLSDAALLHALEATITEHASSLTDEELLRELATAKAAVVPEAQLQDY